MTDSPAVETGSDVDLPADLGFETTRAAQAEHWAATTPDQRLAWLAEAQRFAQQADALPRPRPSADLDGWN